MDPISFVPDSNTWNAMVEPALTSGTTSPRSRALNQAVSQAIGVLNSAGYAGENREITFSVDRQTQSPIIRVVDIQTKEVLQQWPPEYLLQLAADLKKQG